MRARSSLRSGVLGAVGAALLLTGCPPPEPSIVAPRAGALVDDASVVIEGKVPRRFTTDASVVRVDGVDLVAALALVPPFADASGSVVIGDELVAVSEFTYTIPPTGPVVIQGRLAGLAADAHVLELEATPSAGGAPSVRTRAFAVVESFTLEAEVAASSGKPPAGVFAPPGGGAGNVTLGESLAAPPASAPGVGTLRAGFVPVARARTAAP